MYGIPALLIVTWRGYAGKDAPEHILMGEVTPSLLDLLGIPHRVLSHASVEDDLRWAAREFDARGAPIALLVPPGQGHHGGGGGSAHSACSRGHSRSIPREPPGAGETRHRRVTISDPDGEGETGG
jgi:hypothetical protein